MRGMLGSVFVAFLLAGAAQAAPYSIKVQKAPPPKELSPAVAAELSHEAVDLLNAKGNLVAQVWFRKAVPLKAQLAGAPTYQDLQQTTLLGAIRFPAQVRDYRKQKIKPGVYTLRLGFQPMDGDHMGTAPDPYFALLVSAAKDKQPGPIADPKHLYDLSGKSIGKTHPGVLLLYPVDKISATPKLVNKGSGTWAVEWKEATTGGNPNSVLGIALTLIGHTTAE